MSYTSLGYMLFVACCLIFYYIFPKKHRWWVLLAASIGFYAIVCLKYISFVFVTAASTYAGGRILEAYANSSLFCGIGKAEDAGKKINSIPRG